MTIEDIFSLISANVNGSTESRKSEEKESITNVREKLQQIAVDICNNYCKYPETWDEEKEGCELSESEICENCPLNDL